MRTYDAMIVGGGIAGSVAAALLSKQGKKVLLVESGDRLGGRGATFEYEGFQLNLGAHLLEDPGSGLTAIMRYLGKDLEESTISDAMPVWHENRWRHVNELYKADKEELKTVIKEIVETGFEEFDRYDNIPFRAWLLKRTKSDGVIALFEFISMLEVLTDEWYDHSASDNLYVRKMHYGERRIGGFSFFPKGGFQPIFDQLAQVIEGNGGIIELNRRVRRIVLEGPVVEGVEVEIAQRSGANDLPDVERVQSPVVICTLPVWNVFDIVDPDALPSWYVNQIGYMARETNKASWIGFYAASEEPIYALS